MSAPRPLLEVSGLSVVYGSIRAVDSVSLTVDPGEIVTLIGANGAGKSTLLRAISGLLPAAAGTVTFDSAPITGLPPHRIVARGLGHVPEGRLIFSNLTVDENLAMGAYLVRDAHRVAAHRAQVLDLFPRLAERRTQQAGTLSGGEQQMLAIGRALMGGPRLLMLDEPSLGLAPKLVASIFERIVTINRERGITILLVEQNAHLALEVSHRAYVLESGRIVAHGPSGTLRDDPQVRAAYLGG